MGCVRFSFSCSALSAGHMESRSIRRSGARSVRIGRSLRVIRAAQVSGFESQAVPAAEGCGHMGKSRTLYEVLGLSRGASAQDIKSAYRKLARQFHPDAAAATPQAKSLSTDMFMQIHNAYAILSKPEDRAQYDRQLVMRQGQRWNRAHSRVGYRDPSGHVGRNWETDQCW